MKLGICSCMYADSTLESVCHKFSEYNIKTMEITADLKGKQINISKMLRGNPGAQEEIKRVKEVLQRYRMEIGSVNAAGNPLHPVEKIREKYRKHFENAVRTAAALGVDTVIVFSGTPGGAPGDSTPNWVTCPWPEENLEILKYQWEEELIPYWRQAVEFAESWGISKIAFEMHPGFCVYNPETLLRLRDAVGKSIGVNLDPNHLVWQGMEPESVIRELKDCIFSVHAKDVFVNEEQIRKNGVNDAKHYSYAAERSWTFRTVGYGNGEEFWKKFLSALRIVGYDGAVNIEHEDLLLSKEEGMRKAAQFLDKILIREKAGEMWWA